MKCWKCGGHMTKHNGIAICDSCGRTVYKRSGSATSDNSGTDYSLSEIFGLLGIAGLATIISNRLDSETEERTVNKESHRISFKRFVRSCLYSALALIFLVLGVNVIIYGFEQPPKAGMSSMLMVVSGMLVIWGGILIAFLKEKERLSFKNILGSVMANIICKFIGLFIIFSDIPLIDNISFAMRLIIGGYLLLFSHTLYKIIKNL